MISVTSTLYFLHQWISDCNPKYPRVIFPLYTKCLFILFNSCIQNVRIEKQISTKILELKNIRQIGFLIYQFWYVHIVGITVIRVRCVLEYPCIANFIYRFLIMLGFQALKSLFMLEFGSPFPLRTLFVILTQLDYIMNTMLVTVTKGFFNWVTQMLHIQNAKHCHKFHLGQ